MEGWKRLLLENKAWAQDRATRPREAPDAARAEFLWIGSSDSLVPPEQTVGAGPGELIVHRNMANLVHATDMNLGGVLDYGVRQVGVEHVIICGHYDCHGIRLAMEREPCGRLDQWLAQVRETWYAHKDELGVLDADAARRRLVELNVLHQVHNLARSALVQRAWTDHQRPTLHGWVYNHADDLITPLVKIDANASIDDIFRYRGSSDS